MIRLQVNDLYSHRFLVFLFRLESTVVVCYNHITVGGTYSIRREYVVVVCHTKENYRSFRLNILLCF